MIRGIIEWLRSLWSKPTIPPLIAEQEIAENFDDPKVVSVKDFGVPRSLAAPDTIKRNVCLITVKFSDSSAMPPSNSTIWSVFKTGTKNVYDFYESMSYGATFLTGQVFGPFTITRGTTGCDHRGWITQAKEKLAATGVDLTQFTNFAVFGPASTACGFAGIASVSGNYIYINGVATWATLAHELGHNFGLGHARSSTCPTGCGILTYGDAYDRMGGGQHGFSAPSRMYMGILSSNNFATVASTGTYTLEALERKSEGVKLLRIARGDGTFINVSTRRSIGSYSPATSSPAMTGLMIQISDAKGRTLTTMDTHPATSSRADSPLQVNETWTDPLSKVKVKHVGAYDLHSRVGITIPTS